MILDVENLEFGYRSKPVVRDITFSLKEGEILTILGPNGAGKSTLLKCLNHVLSPRKGRVRVEGTDLGKLSRNQIAQRIGWVPQHGEPSRIKIHDLILLGRKPFFRWAPGKDDYQKVAEIIRLMGIEDLSLRYADEISGGEFQLVQIVRALAQQPRALLLDEPTSNLDISNQHRIMQKIRNIIHSSSRSAVLTLHDINLALRYSDQFLLLKNGQIRTAGDRSVITPQNIKDVYGMDVLIEEAGGYPVMVPV